MKPEEVNNLSNEELKKRVIWCNKKHEPYFEKRSLKNWKNLFRKPTSSEWTVLLIIILLLFGSWAYERDTRLCRETMDTIEEDSCKICMSLNQNTTMETRDTILSEKFKLKIIEGST